MATTFYFPETLAADVTPPVPVGSTTWEHINSPLPLRKLLTTADSSTLTTTAYTPDAADDLTDKDSCHRQYVSDILGAQTISGNITGQFQATETFANDNLFLSMKVLVCSQDGTTTRATLLAITRSSASEIGTSLANRTFPSTALSSYACAEGDRIVIEIGVGGSISSGTGGTIGHNGSLRFGCSASSGDLPVDNTTTTTTYRPWVQFSNSLIFSSGPVTVTPGVATLTTSTFAPTAIPATETFTHADQAGSLSADRTWTLTAGTAWGIVSNQAKISGNNSSTARMEVDADLSTLVSATATLVSFAGGDATHFAQIGIGVQDGDYEWIASRGSSGDLWQLWRFSGTPAQLGSTVTQAIVNGQTFGISWNPASNTIKGYIAGVEKISQVDSTTTTKKRCVLDVSTNDTAMAIIVDDVYLTPILQSVTVTPGIIALTTATFAPTVTATDNKVVTPDIATLVLSTFAPGVAVGVNVVPDTLALTTTTFVPTVTTTNNQLVIPDLATLSTATFVPTVTASDNKVVTPDSATLSLTTFVPTVLHTYSLVVDVGAYTLSTAVGQDTLLIFSGSGAAVAPLTLATMGFGR